MYRRRAAERRAYKEVALAIWQVAIAVAVERFLAGGEETDPASPLELEDREWEAGFGGREEPGAQSIEDYWHHLTRR